jgi:hypothetical protein
VRKVRKKSVACALLHLAHLGAVQTANLAAGASQTGRLHLAVIDPAALGRPRAKGFADLQVYEVKGAVPRR